MLILKLIISDAMLLGIVQAGVASAVCVVTTLITLVMTIMRDADLAPPAHCGH